MNGKQHSLYDMVVFGFRAALDNIHFLLKTVAVCAAVLLTTFALIALLNINVGNQIRVIAEGLRTCVGHDCITAIAPLMNIASLRLLFSVLFFCFMSCAIMAGYTKIILNLHDKKPVALDLLFRYAYLAPKLFISGMLYLLIVAFGLTLFVIPGLIWSARFGLFSIFIVDQNAGIIDSLRNSYRVTTGYAAELIGLWGLTMIISGLARFSILGFIILVPTSSFAFVHMYRALTSK